MNGPADPTGGSGAWTGTFGSLACNADFRLYCLQRDFSSTLRISPAAGRRAFVTDSLSTVGGGLAAADAECMSNAQNAGLSGVFLALMATSTASPASRFSTAGAPWVPLDGIRWPPPLRIEHPLGSMTPRIKEWL